MKSNIFGSGYLLFYKASHRNQLITGNGWLHISWKPLGIPRHYVRIRYYK